jgi:hypothetical protein
MITHPVSDPSVVWYGGMGHRLLSEDDGAVSCFRCGMFADGDVPQELLPDCAGPEGGTDHHFIASPDGIECAYGDAAILDAGASPDPLEPCTRA